MGEFLVQSLNFTLQFSSACVQLTGLSFEPGSKLLVLGMGDLQPLIGNPYNGYINPYELGLMSLSPTIWKCHGSLDPIARLEMNLCFTENWTDSLSRLGTDLGGELLQNSHMAKVHNSQVSLTVLLTFECLR